MLLRCFFSVGVGVMSSNCRDGFMLCLIGGAHLPLHEVSPLENCLFGISIGLIRIPLFSLPLLTLTMNNRFLLL